GLGSGLGLGGHVGLFSERLACSLFDRWRGGARGIECAGGADHAGALAGKQARARLPDARTRPGDHAYLAVEPAHRLSDMLKLRCLSIKLGSYAENRPCEGS